MNLSKAYTTVQIGMKRGHFWLALLNIRFFLLHALLQPLKHTLFTNSLNVPSNRRKKQEY